MISILDGFNLEMGRALFGIATFIAIAVVVFAGCFVSACIDSLKDRRKRRAGCYVCGEPATKVVCGSGERWYCCRSHHVPDHIRNGSHGACPLD